MADDNFFDGDIFVYRGGRAPQHVTHARIDKSADEIEENAFRNCHSLVQVDTHDGIRRVGNWAFSRCNSLRQINLKSAVEIGYEAFYKCENLESVEFGDRLETIGIAAFNSCSSLKHLKLPSIITIGKLSFGRCTAIDYVELSERIETIEVRAFIGCGHLQRIAIPLKRDLFSLDDDVFGGYNQFYDCEQLTTVHLVGGVHKTIASLHMESWRTEMITEINRINQVLPNTSRREKTEEIRQWIYSVIDKMDYYKAEHCGYVREGITLLELALWKAKLGEKEDTCEAGGRIRQAKADAESARKDKRMICGADMVINNVLPFLQLE